MTNIKALEKMRELCADVKSMDFASVGCDAVLEIADEIEQEIAERYIELPVDAEGVPIRVGDVVEFGEYRNKGIVKAVNERMVIAMFIDDTCTNYAKHGLLWDADLCRHVKPRTIEDVLREFADEVQRCCDTTDTITDYAEEIRGMMA